jgi:hypothetical protein
MDPESDREINFILFARISSIFAGLNKKLSSSLSDNYFHLETQKIDRAILLIPNSSKI